MEAQSLNSVLPTSDYKPNHKDLKDNKAKLIGLVHNQSTNLKFNQISWWMVMGLSHCGLFMQVFAQWESNKIKKNKSLSHVQKIKDYTTLPLFLKEKKDKTMQLFKEVE